MLTNDLPAAERIILAVDTSELHRAEELIALAHDAGAKTVKMGLEISSGTSWWQCGQMAADQEMDWVADAKIDDIPNTTAGIVRNLVALEHPPVGITIHTNSGIESMRAAEDIAGPENITMLGVTHLTSIDDDETRRSYKMTRDQLVDERLTSALIAGIGGYVCSPKELSTVVKPRSALRNRIGMIPGTRSVGEATHDQANANTPGQAITDGASLLVIGRQVTKAEDPAQAFKEVTAEIQASLDAMKGGEA